MDISDTLQAKSDQLNADDLVGGPITVQVEGVRRMSVGQPLAIAISGGHMPFRPCKNMRRLLAAAWGIDARKWEGRWIRLYRDPDVQWAGEAVGGVRISHLSHMEHPEISLVLNLTRKSKTRVTVRRLDTPRAEGAPTASLDALLEDEGLTIADLDAWRASKSKGPISEMTDDQRSQLASWLGSRSERIDEVRVAANAPVDDGRWAGEEG